MLTVGDTLPSFSLLTVAGGALSRDFATTTEKSYPGKWLVLFAWPKDFTFVCPTEIAEFGKKGKEFAERDAQVLGFSTDTEFVHHAWRTHHEDLKDLAIPMLGIVVEDAAEREVFRRVADVPVLHLAELAALNEEIHHA